MSTVGWVGLGRLGAPCAAALQRSGGHSVIGYDVRGVDPDEYDWAGEQPVQLVKEVDDVVQLTDGVVFVAVQTPHSPSYGGDTLTPDEPRDFEYAYLVEAVAAVCRAALDNEVYVTLVVVSTVLPGTFNRLLRPLLNDYVTPVYHPFFIAMGTVVDDFIAPEMTLFGVDHPDDAKDVLEVYRPIHHAPAPVISITSAELAKVAYNTFISMKIVFANALMELSEGTGADVDEVTGALAHATQRVISTRYLRAGMGDGGACHPRDNIALSALAQRVGASADVMGYLMSARALQTGWLADVVERWRDQARLPVLLLGVAYKPNVPLTDGSPALLLSELLTNAGVAHEAVDPVVEPAHGELLTRRLRYPHIYVLTTDHDRFLDLVYPPGSVVIDPHGVVRPRPGVVLVTPGRRRYRRPRIVHND